jgi:hypothetical protein
MLWDPYLENGRYRNPVLYADYSDPDVVRVGGDYYLTASSFSNAPGLPVLHSRDLVGWRLISHALRRIPGEAYGKPVYGCGVWAPAIRHHNGLFWIFFGMPDEGIFFVTAKDPAGEWSPPVLLAEAKGWIDPCPFWDDDGRAYLVHAFAKSRCGVKSLLRLVEMSPDGSGLVGEGKIIFDGHNTQPTIEGPKLYKRDGYYYILAPAGGVGHGWQTALRSKSIWGSYEEKIVMIRGGASGVNGPHQGGWVDTEAGEDWFLHFQDIGYAGRVTHLQPMRWEDGWPTIGSDPGGEGYGSPVDTWARPALPCCEGFSPACSDDFSGSSLGEQWLWNANPRPEWHTLTKEGLRLNAMPLPPAFGEAANMLLQLFPRPDFTATAQAELSGLSPGGRLSLLILGRSYGALTACRTPEGLSLEYRTGKLGQDCDITIKVADSNALRLVLSVTVDPQGICRFAFGLPGGALHEAGLPFAAERGVWTGAKIGLLCGGSQPGSALITSFVFENLF